MKLLVDNIDISELVTTVTWSGDTSSACRKVQYNYIQSYTDQKIPKINVKLGSVVELINDTSQLLFKGRVYTNNRSHDNVHSVSCYDYAYNLLSELPMAKYNCSADLAAHNRIKEFNIQSGTLISTPQVFFYLQAGKSAYHHIMAAYTKASVQTGKKYFAVMLGDKFYVHEKGIPLDILLSADSNLTYASYEENAESIINNIVVTDDRGYKTDSIGNSDLIQTFGILQKIYQKEDGKDYQTAALAKLQNIEYSGSITAMGNEKAISGYAIKIQDKMSGLTGIFHIESDTHTWNNGQYEMNLDLAFKNIMTEYEEDTNET